MLCAQFDAGRCRSCTQLSIPYEAQLRQKQAQLKALLAFPESCWLPACASREAGFRNKAKMVVSGRRGTPVLGIQDAEGRPVDLCACPLYSSSMQRALQRLRDFIATLGLTPYDVQGRRGELKFVLLTEGDDGHLLLRWVLRSEAELPKLRQALPKLQAQLPQLEVVSANLQPEHKAVLEGEREILLTGASALRITVNGLPLFLQPKSFFQTNTEVASALYAQARQWIEACAPATVWDLFCGVGGFALHAAAAGRQVTGIELSGEAIASAERSRVALNLSDRELRFESLDATRFALRGDAVAEQVIVNPPRRGIGRELAEFLDASHLRWLIYSSCNPDSLRRDLQAMPGLQVRAARLFDLFPHTDHAEVLILAERVGR